ncbi:MAG: helix-turn-helix domain-containing protein, partial [Acidimicrobiales bacterium]
PILVVAPWLSARTQGILAKDGINYLDLTGNIRIETASSPMIFLSSQGATRNPATAPRSKASLRGPKAGRLFRFLADVTPPYGVTQIASATGLAAGYVSRLLETMDDEALIERSRRGQVLSTATTSILRRWAEIYGVFKTNRAASFVAPQGPANLLGHFDDPGIEGNVAVTGSFAAVRLAPVAGPALLVAYSNKPDAVSAQLGLLPAERGANVVLLGPFDEVVWERTTVDNGVTYVTPSQVAVDCLTGNGRMPAEGEALLAWMEQNESRWRLLSIDAIRVDGAGT